MRSRGRIAAWIGVVCLGAVTGGLPRAFAAEPLEVPVELWDRPRSGQAVLAVPAVRQALSALQTRANVRLAIRHGPGQEPAAQAEELKAWLVAHAVEPGRITLRVDAAALQALRLEVVSDGKP